MCTRFRETIYEPKLPSLPRFMDVQHSNILQHWQITLPLKYTVLRFRGELLFGLFSSPVSPRRPYPLKVIWLHFFTRLRYGCIDSLDRGVFFKPNELFKILYKFFSLLFFSLKRCPIPGGFSLLPLPLGNTLWRGINEKFSQFMTS